MANAWVVHGGTARRLQQVFQTKSRLYSRSRQATVWPLARNAPPTAAAASIRALLDLNLSEHLLTALVTLHDANYPLVIQYVLQPRSSNANLTALIQALCVAVGNAPFPLSR
eukprot:3106985-Rhodomonas_salina.2